MHGMTEVQWKDYLPTLEGMKIDNWTGWVVDIDKVSGEEYKIWVDMDEPSSTLSTQDVYLWGISKEDAEIISKGAQITFSGIIKYASAFLGDVAITVEDVIYQIDG